mgnify:CR=1 FL=1
MKNQLLLLLGLSFLGTTLFYGEVFGINLLVSGVLFAMLMAWKNQETGHRVRWWLSIGLVIASGIGGVWHGSNLAFIGLLVGLLLLGTLTIAPRLSVLWSFLTGLVSAVLAPFTLFAQFNALQKKQLASPAAKIGLSTTGILVFLLAPTVIGLLFLALYRSSNPAFATLIEHFEFNFWSWGHTFFTLLIFTLISGLWFPRLKGRLVRIDRLANNRLNPRLFSGKASFSFFQLHQEMWFGVFLLVLLNFLLLLVNLTDAIFWLGDRALPGGVSYMELVHEGVGTLMMSIVLVILILLFFFKGELNFFRQNLWLKGLAYVWMFQNLLLIGFTMARNFQYIEALGLTYKRIGVMVWLLLAIIGFALMFWKVVERKSTWFLIRRFSEAALVCLLLASVVDWTNLVTRYNLHAAEVKQEMPDWRYLRQIGPGNLAQIAAHAQRHNAIHDPLYVSSTYVTNLAHTLDNDLFLTGWPSWSVNAHSNRTIAEEILEDAYPTGVQPAISARP